MVTVVTGIAASLALVGCGSFSQSTNAVTTFISPYHMEVVQGNFVSKEQVDALKPGMTRNQVRDVLGTPLIVSLFHSDRWDYVFTLKRQGIASQARRLTVYFKSDVLEHFDGDEMPSEADFVAKLESRKLGKEPLLEAAPESLQKFAPSKPAQVPPPPAAITDNYPPLESALP